jgi:hypothetical protein
VFTFRYLSNPLRSEPDVLGPTFWGTVGQKWHKQHKIHGVMADLAHAVVLLHRDGLWRSGGRDLMQLGWVWGTKLV